MDARVILVLVMGILGWAYQAIQPPPPKICGSSNGPPVTSTRVRLRDGRHMAYMEQGVPKEMAKYKIVLVHGFDGTKEFSLPASQEVVEELGIYFVSFDRAGYGESDPYPQRSAKSEAFDIQDLADQLELGLKFYVIGFSWGGYSVWGCLKYIPHRLQGAALIAPAINFWWPSFPANLSREAYRKQLVQDQWTLRIAHYTRPLFYWWMTQKWFPSSSYVQIKPEIFSPQDKEIMQKILANRRPSNPDKGRQQGDYECLHRDLMVGFGTWEFDPMDIVNSFPHNEGSVHIWQGYEDRLVPVTLQRYVSERLPWIRYHELPDGGHLFFNISSLSDNILKALLLGEEVSSTSA
eukprot:TRINITY_DN3869_c0_g1_i1.p1 TRINITY_DN3869_c0_g1~~TRINITY_DN3869_c0_g1_i1.p1  ORF type:complete len:350 (+),score=49.49 TRINITY_DN3869_c0_g1_i1:55-1104(+)